MKNYIQRYPIGSFFVIAYLISWGSGLLVLGPKLFRGAAVPPTDGLLLFPILVVGVALTGIVLTGVRAGRNGVRELFSRMGRWKVGVRWYLLALLTPPILILIVLVVLRTLVSPVYSPNFFPLGLLFGLVPGFLEEIGWTGYAFPLMQVKQGALSAGIVLGLLWGFWHLPVVDSLGAASPHGVYWLPFVLAFVALVSAMRVLIAWVFSHTGSLLLAQLMHASSTGCLVILGPAGVSPAQEVLWYAIYALVLWGLVAVVAAVAGADLK